MTLNKNKTFVFFLKLSVTVICLYLVFSKAGAEQILSVIRSINPVYFLSASLIYILAQLVSAFRWKLLLTEAFSIRRLFSLYMIGAFFSSFLPGIIGGDAVKAYYLNKDAKKLSLTLASIFMDRYIGYTALMIIGITSFPFALRYFGTSESVWIIPVIFIAFVIGSFLFFGLRVGRRFKGVTDFYDYFKRMKTKKDAVMKAFLLSLIIQLLNFAMIIVLAFGLGKNIPILVLCVVLPIVVTVTSIPISVSGLGVREGAFMILLGLIGVSPEVSTSLSLTWFFSIFVGSIPGLVAYMRYRSRTEQNERSDVPR
ncbi:MAG: flippase-like domain-containing protein [Nitrospiraceae bacterium]|nr:MAG: flippase-like domain-containing protein [Nitrospiraceae bacterium]